MTDTPEWAQQQASEKVEGWLAIEAWTSVSGEMGMIFDFAAALEAAAERGKVEAARVFESAHVALHSGKEPSCSLAWDAGPHSSCRLGEECDCFMRGRDAGLEEVLGLHDDHPGCCFPHNQILALRGKEGK